MMKTYLVGGAVRDRLLGQPIGDRDWVVVGATVDAMLTQGFKPVGRDFPVFLHPVSGEEYALARTERKSGQGYRGFTVHADPNVTLEEDLLRRDFTLNAIAEDENGTLIDPYGGIRDLERRVLRHVSPAFVEDPLRVLRAGRLMARFAPLGFTVAPETLELMSDISASGELEALTVERVWQELQRTLTLPRPSAFLQTLRSVGALRRILPEVDALYGVPQRAEFHPEIDTGIHQERVSDMVARLAPGDALTGFAALTHDLGKALTPANLLPRHIGHEHRGLAPLNRLCERLKVPNEYRQLARIVCREHLNIHNLGTLRPRSIYALFERCGLFRRPERVERIAIVCEADKRGRLGRENVDYPQGRWLRLLYAEAAAVSSHSIDTTHLVGPAIGEALSRARIAAIRRAKVACSV